jgi:sugar-specific transcriptional regulator TrmB
METNDEGKAEKNFKSFGKKVDVFISEFQEATERLEKEFQQKFEELKITAEKLKKEAENKERWQEVEISLKKAGDEVANAFRAAFKKKDVEGDNKQKEV